MLKASKRRSKNSLEGIAKLLVHIAEMQAGLSVSGQSVLDGNPGEHSTATSGEESTLQLEIVAFAHAHRGVCAHVCKLIPFSVEPVEI